MPPFKIGNLGEIAIRCADLPRMERWYRETLGLEPLDGGHSDGIVFLRICDGFAGHTTVLALFRHDAGRPDIHPSGPEAPQTGARSSLHHIALSLSRTEQENAIKWFEREGVAHNIQHFGWVGWRGVFLTDPEGNTVELVAYDAAFRDGQS